MKELGTDKLKGTSADGSDPDVVKVASSNPEIKKAQNPLDPDELGKKTTTNQTMNDGDYLGGFLNPQAKSDPVVVTPEDKIAFIDAIVQNKRFTRSFSVFGGKLTFTLRSRTFAETSAILSYASSLVATNLNIPYRYVLTLSILAAEVDEFQGVKNPVLKDPLYKEIGTDGKISDVGWANQLDFWKSLPDSVIQAISDCAVEFERKYTALSNAARTANFWEPDTSTAR